MPAILEAWKAGLLGREHLGRNVVAGIIVGVVAIPLAMAFAIASGASPVQGLYTALVAGMVVSLFGGSRVQIAGPTGAFVVLLAGVTAKYGIAGLQVVTLLAGAILVAFGLAKLGGVIRYIPESVILGFTAGIAIVIFVGQIPAFLGLPAVGGATLAEKLPELVAVLSRAHVPTAALGVVALLVNILWQKVPVVGKIPSPLVVLVGATLYVALFAPAGVATIGSVFGGIPAGLPPLTMPDWGAIDWIDMARPAFAIALLGAIESLLSATVADGFMGTRHDPNQELVGQGLANVGASFFGGFAATGALARTATSVRHGGTSPVAGIVHGVVILLVLLVFAPLASYVPLAALSAILFVVAYNMGQFGRVLSIARRAPRSDVAVMLITLVLAALADLTLAVEVGVVLAMLNFFRRMTRLVEVRTVGGEELAGHAPGSSRGLVGELPDGVLVYTIDGPFFFGAIEQFESALLHSDTDPAAIVIVLDRVPFVDLTGLVALKDAVERLERRKIQVAFAGANARVAECLVRTGISATVDLESTAPLYRALDAVAATGERVHNQP